LNSRLGFPESGFKPKSCFDKAQKNVQSKFRRAKVDDEASLLWAKYDTEVVPSVIF
jgi:hypothetical protein